MQINWAINTAPPFHILQGEYKQQGLCDVLVQTVHRYLPELNGKTEVLPQPRISRALERSDNLCFPCMIAKAQGDGGVYFSLPTHVYYPHVIITNAINAQRIKRKYAVPVALSELLADEQFHFGYPAGRRYGILQPYIEGFDNKPGNRLVRSGDNGPVAILQMISSGRLDYTLDYNIIKRYYELTTGEALTLIPVAENSQQPVFGAIGCSNNAWGRAAIERINTVIPLIRKDADFMQSLEFWFDSNADTGYSDFNTRHLRQANPD
ncbi:MAG: hypothetical protein R3241_05075 [Rheinheimera sp.]|nr:hypothetical protein [Rheinheimera sp.]